MKRRTFAILKWSNIYVVMIIAGAFALSLEIAGFPYLIIPYSLISIVIALRLHFKLNDVAILAIIQVVVLPSMFWSSGTGYYFIWPTLSLVTTFPFMAYFKMINTTGASKSLNEFILPVLVLSTLMVYELYFFAGNRLQFQLGPNMMYRFVIMTFAIAYLATYKRFGVIYKVGLIGLTTALILAIGSRGGLLAWTSVLIFLLFGAPRWVKISAPLAFLFFFWNYLSEVELKSLEEFFGRAVYFSLENRSEAIRFHNIIDFIDWLRSINLVKLFFGAGYGNEPYPFYPHNLLIELWHSSGVMTLVFTAYIILYAFIVGSRRLVCLFLVPNFLGAMVSGSMLDNYYIVSIALALIATYRMSPLPSELSNKRSWILKKPISWSFS